MPKWFNISRNKFTNTAADVYVYDEIGGWGITAKEFVDELNALNGIDTINLHVNSPGGSVVEVIAMMTALKQHPASIVAYVDGLAASSASRLILVANEIEMASNAFIMIHNVWTIAIGNATDLRKEADLLDKFDDGLVNDYVKRTGKSPDEVRALLEEDTWFNADEALDFGIIDRIGEEQQAAACVSKRFANLVQEMRNKPEDFSVVEGEPFTPQSNGPISINPDPPFQGTPLADIKRRLAELQNA